MRRLIQDAEQTRHTIIDVAEELFLINGVSRTSLEMIAKERGLTRGTVHRHFKDKAHLIQGMLERIRIPSDEVAQQLRADGEGDCLVKLYNLCVECIERYIRPGRDRRVMMILVRRCELSDELYEFEKYKNAATRNFLITVESLFESQRQRLHEKITPTAASLQLHSIFTGTLASVLRDEDLFSPLLNIRLIFTLYFRSFVKDWQ